MSAAYEHGRAIAPFMDERDDDEPTWVFIVSEQCPEYTLYTVGFYDPSGRWVPESDHNSAVEAAARVAYLNGRGGC